MEEPIDRENTFNPDMLHGISGVTDEGLPSGMLTTASCSSVFAGSVPTIRRSWCLRGPALACLLASNVMLPLICAAQMFMLDYEILQHEGWTATGWASFLILCDILLVLHMSLHLGSAHAVRSGSLQWIIYSWLFSIKCCILYFDVLPSFNTASDLNEVRNTISLLWPTPLFYCVLMLRTLRQLFRVEQPGHYLRRGVVRDRQDHLTLDVVLLTDMVWHVVIDMIDIINMMFFATPAQPHDSIADQVVLNEYPDRVASVRQITGAFVFLGLFFHQQSFPGIGFSAPRRDAYGPSRASASRPTEVGDPVEGPAVSGQRSKHRAVPEYTVDVVKARKRSAIISILLVDVPFLSIRSYMYFLSMSTTAQRSGEVYVGGFNATSEEWHELVGRPQLDKWWVKNILCMLLQAMQLRFVQQADLERSQSLKWWDVRRAGDGRGPYRGSGRKQRSEQDADLTKFYQDMQGDLLDAAMEETGELHALAESEERYDEPSSSASGEDARSGAAHLPESPEPASPSRDVRRSRCWHRWRCCGCGRRSRDSGAWYCAFCGCECSWGVMLHALMGAFLGWLIARTDFTQTVDDLVKGLGMPA